MFFVGGGGVCKNLTLDARPLEFHKFALGDRQKFSKQATKADILHIPNVPNVPNHAEHEQHQPKQCRIFESTCASSTLLQPLVG